MVAVYPVAAQDAGTLRETVAPPETIALPETVGEISREILVQSDHEGLFMQRTTVDIAGTRWLWRSEGTIVLHEKTAMAGGYVEERRMLGAPREEFAHWAGCEAGPLTLGPIAFRGLYHRLLDPTAGGTSWSALSDGPDLRLDRSMEPSRWTGVGIDGVLPLRIFGGEIAPGAVWGTTDDGDVAAGALALSWPVAAVDVSVSHGSFSVTPDDSWLYTAPPFRAESITQLGSTIILKPTVAEVSVEVGAEGWQQRTGYRPRRYSAGAFADIPGAWVAIASRVSRTQSGFRALTGRRPRSAEYSGLTLSEGRRMGPWLWHVDWNRRAGWDEDLPGDPVDTYSVMLGGAWRRGIVRMLRVRATRDSRGTLSLNYRMRYAVGPVGLLAYARNVFDDPAEGESFSATVRGSVRTDLGRHGRRFSVDAGWSISQERTEQLQELSISTSVPIGRAVRMELSVKRPLVPGAWATGEETEWLVRVRYSGPNESSPATTPE